MEIATKKENRNSQMHGRKEKKGKKKRKKALKLKKTFYIPDLFLLATNHTFDQNLTASNKAVVITIFPAVNSMR